MPLQSIPQRHAKFDRSNRSEEQDKSDDADEEPWPVQLPHQAKADDHDGEPTQVTDLVSLTLHGLMIVVAGP
jgi:hypothetical protein